MKWIDIKIKDLKVKINEQSVEDAKKGLYDIASQTSKKNQFFSQDYCALNFRKSIQCRIQNRTPATGGRLLFNKIKIRKIARGIIVNKK